jgi:colicin import membrane protein/protein TonB
VSVPFVTALNQRDRLWPVVLASIALHVAVFSVALKVSSRPELVLEQTPITAKLVRLGEKKPEQLLPQKEPPPPPPEPAPQSPPVVTEAPPPTDTPPTPTAPTPVPAVARPPPARPSARSPANGAGTSITDILARNAQAVKRQQFGDPSGDPEGNADEASAGERYDGLLTKALLASWHLPPTISEKELLHLHAIPRVWILPDGTVTRWEIVASSGNGQFDAAMERALQDLRAARAPPPPPELRDELRTQGRKLWFKP